MSNDSGYGFGLGLFSKLRIAPHLNDLYEVREKGLLAADGQRATLKLDITPPEKWESSIDSFADIVMRHASTMSLVYACTCRRDGKELFKDSASLLHLHADEIEEEFTGKEQCGNTLAVIRATDIGVSITIPILVQVPPSYWDEALQLQCSLQLSVESAIAAAVPAFRQSSALNDGEEAAMRLLLENNRYRPTKVPPQCAFMKLSLYVIQALQLKSRNVELSPCDSLLLLEAHNLHPLASITLLAVTAQSAESEQFHQPIENTNSVDDRSAYVEEGRPVDVSALFRFQRLIGNESINSNGDNGAIVTIPPKGNYTFAFKITPQRPPNIFAANSKDTSYRTDDNIMTSNGEFLWHPSLLGCYRTPLSVQWTEPTQSKQQVLQRVQRHYCNWSLGTASQSAMSKQMQINRNENETVQHDKPSQPPISSAGLMRQWSGTSTLSSNSGAHVDEANMRTPVKGLSLTQKASSRVSSPQPPSSYSSSPMSGISARQALQAYYGNDGNRGGSSATPLQINQRQQNEGSNTQSSTKGLSPGPITTALENMQLNGSSLKKQPTVLVSPLPRSEQTIQALHHVSSTSINNSPLPGNHSPMRTLTPLPVTEYAALSATSTSSFRVTVHGPPYGIVNKPVTLSVSVLNVSQKVFLGLQLSTSYTCGDSDNGHSILAGSLLPVGGTEHVPQSPSIDGTSPAYNLDTVFTPDFLVSECRTEINGVLKPGDQCCIELTALPLKSGQSFLTGLHLHDPHDGFKGRNYALLQNFSLLVLEEGQSI